MKKTTGVIFIISVLFFTELNAQTFFNFDKRVSSISYRDSIKIKSKPRINAGGVFITPLLGLAFPFKEFGSNSNAGLIYGLKLDFASFKLHPFVLGITYQSQKNDGSEEFKTLNRLNSLETNISSFGVCVDILLNSFLKSNFTIPFVTLEAKYYNVTRTLSPDSPDLNIKPSDNLIGISAGAGITLFIFDIYGTYNYAKEYSSIALNTRFHFPLVKF